ncbi:DUF6086 family protein [Streptomyces sp. AA1529]|uniref:DUF6086 family protein n=1 Tax=Streptomyces sp. AA1529 TaxID=1203257 RepID=UPI00307A8DE2
MMIRLDTLTCHDQMKGVEMSQYFDIGDETLWNPSNGVSRMFQRQVGVFEAELELPSGIGPMVNDECQISPDTFEIFVSALLAQHRKTHHTIRHALCEGFTATVLVLAERAGIKVDWTRHGAAPGSPARRGAGLHRGGRVRPCGRHNLVSGPPGEGTGVGTAYAPLTRATAYVVWITFPHRSPPQETIYDRRTPPSHARPTPLAHALPPARRYPDHLTEC